MGADSLPPLPKCLSSVPFQFFHIWCRLEFENLESVYLYTICILYIDFKNTFINFLCWTWSLLIAPNKKFLEKQWNPYWGLLMIVCIVYRETEQVLILSSENFEEFKLTSQLKYKYMNVGLGSIPTQCFHQQYWEWEIMKRFCWAWFRTSSGI